MESNTSIYYEGEVLKIKMNQRIYLADKDTEKERYVASTIFEIHFNNVENLFDNEKCKNDLLQAKYKSGYIFAKSYACDFIKQEKQSNTKKYSCVSRLDDISDMYWIFWKEYEEDEIISNAIEIASELSAKRQEMEELRWHIKKIRDEINTNRSKFIGLLSERDGYKCKICGARESLAIDHIKPVIKYGDNELDNLQLLCNSCNSSKGSKYEEEESIDE